MPQTDKELESESSVFTWHCSQRAIFVKLHVAVEGFLIQEAFPTNIARAIAIVLV